MVTSNLCSVFAEVCYQHFEELADSNLKRVLREDLGRLSFQSQGMSAFWMVKHVIETQMN